MLGPRALASRQFSVLAAIGEWCFPDPRNMVDEHNVRPDGVPDEWTAWDIETDLGFFDEDTFPAALEGETLEQYCRRVPNIWSPCSDKDDIVEVRIGRTPDKMLDTPIEDWQLREHPLIKIPPNDTDYVPLQPDWHDPEQPSPYLIDGMVPAEVQPEDEASIQELIQKRIYEDLGTNHWFAEAESRDHFWKLLTGEEVGIDEPAEWKYWREVKRKELEAAGLPAPSREEIDAMHQTQPMPKRDPADPDADKPLRRMGYPEFLKPEYNTVVDWDNPPEGYNVVEHDTGMSELEYVKKVLEVGPVELPTKDSVAPPKSPPALDSPDKDGQK